MCTMNVRTLVGSNIRKIRLLCGLTQEALAFDSQIASSFLSQIENGKRSPTVDTLAALAAALGVPIVDFFDETVEKPKGLPRGIRGVANKRDLNDI